MRDWLQTARAETLGQNPSTIRRAMHREPAHSAGDCGHDFSRVNVRAKPDPQPAPQPPLAPRIGYEDCPLEWKLRLRETAADAQAWVNDSLNRIDAFLQDPSKPDAKVNDLLKKHFHIGSGGPKENVFNELTKIRSGYAGLMTAFRGRLPFQCETSCSDALAYVPWGGPFGIFRGMQDIHFCPAWFHDRKPLRQAETIIHEMAHKYLGKDDNADEDAQPAKYQRLSVKDAIDNADSYGAFARDL